MLSSTPDEFEEMSDAVSLMQKTQPNYSSDDLKRIRVPIAVVQSEFDEFIKAEHAEYLSKNIPNATYVTLTGVSHFAPLQRPKMFADVVLKFIRSTGG